MSMRVSQGELRSKRGRTTDGGEARGRKTTFERNVGKYYKHTGKTECLPHDCEVYLIKWGQGGYSEGETGTATVRIMHGPFKGWRTESVFKSMLFALQNKYKVRPLSRNGLY